MQDLHSGRITRAYRSATYERNKIDNQHESKELRENIVHFFTALLIHAYCMVLMDSRSFRMVSRASRMSISSCRFRK